MGNQPSKNGSGTSTPKASTSSTSLDRTGPTLSSLPSFTKSDTKESSRSFKSLRSKIPGTSKTDSPRASISSPINGESSADKSDAASVKSGVSNRSAISKSSRADTAASPDSYEGNSPLNDPEPPPSPIQSASMRHGHRDVSAAQKSGEVDLISDQPPSGAVNPHAHMQVAGKSILVKKANTINPMNSDPAMTTATEEGASSSPAMGIGDIKSLDLDDYITRLIDAAYAGKVTKGVCLKMAEITAICLQAQEVFLSQPALLELDAPVKIVGDIHGQYPDLIRLFEMSGSPPNANFLFLGDYVDRGKQSLETILLLLCYKLKYPENFFC